MPVEPHDEKGRLMDNYELSDQVEGLYLYNRLFAHFCLSFFKLEYIPPPRESTGIQVTGPDTMRVPIISNDLDQSKKENLTLLHLLKIYILTSRSYSQSRK